MNLTKPKTRGILLLLFAAACAAGGWYFLREEPASSPPTAPGTTTAPQAAPRPSVTSPVEAWPQRGTPEFKRVATERGQKWLATRGRDAGSLIAMWDVTADETLLAEAAEKFPNDPRVCLAMIGKAGTDAAKSLPWIERLIAAEPNNPEGFYLKAAALMTGKDRAGALAILHTAATMSGPRDNHLRERIMTVREGALATGAGVGDAAYIALAAPMEHSTLYTAVSGIKQALKQELAEAKAGGHEERILEVAGLGLAVSNRLRGAAAGSLIDSLVASSLERMVLNHLSDDTEIGTEGKTAGQMKIEAAARSQQLADYTKQYSGNSDLLEKSSDTVISEFADRFLLHGEVAANLWLMQQEANKNTP